jgi:RimK family alpha-L-glutamate ligase
MIWILYKSINSESHSYEKKRISEELEKQNIPYKNMDIYDIQFIVSVNNVKFYYKNEEIQVPSLVVNRIGATISPYAKYILSTLHNFGIKCYNTPEVINICTDKVLSYSYFSSKGIDIPKSSVFIKDDNIDILKNNFNKFIMKEIFGRTGNGVFLIKNFESLKRMIQVIKNIGRLNNPFIIQDFIDNKVGQDLRVLIIDNKPVGLMKRTNKSIVSNISSGGRGEKVELTEEVESYCKKICQLLNNELYIGSIDFLFGKDKLIFCEVNVNPGFEGYDKHTNSNFAEQIASYLKIEMERGQDGNAAVC